MSTPAPVTPVPRRLRVVREPEEAREGLPAGYLLLVPEGTDPAALPDYPRYVVAEQRPEPWPEQRSEQWPEAQPATAGPASGGPGVHIDRERHTVHVDGAELDLTYLEFELLAHLARHPHLVHSREQLVAAVWGYGEHVGDGRTVDVHVARVRRKLGPRHRDRIVTVRRVGYKYAP